MLCLDSIQLVGWAPHISTFSQVLDKIATFFFPFSVIIDWVSLILKDRWN